MIKDQSEVLDSPEDIIGGHVIADEITGHVEPERDTVMYEKLVKAYKQSIQRR